MNNTFIYISRDCRIADYYTQFNSKIRNIADFKNQLRRHPYPDHRVEDGMWYLGVDVQLQYS